MKFFRLRSLTGQLIGLMLVALLLSQVLFYFINNSERARSLRTLRQDEFLARANAIARLLRVTDGTLHPQVLEAASTSLSRYWLTATLPEEPLAWEISARNPVA